MTHTSTCAAINKSLPGATRVLFLKKGPCQGACFGVEEIPGGWVAQLVEQRTENPRVGGSIPSPATISLENSLHFVIIAFELYASTGEPLCLIITGTSLFPVRYVLNKKVSHVSNNANPVSTKSLLSPLF